MFSARKEETWYVEIRAAVCVKHTIEFDLVTSWIWLGNGSLLGKMWSLGAPSWEILVFGGKFSSSK